MGTGGLSPGALLRVVPPQFPTWLVYVRAGGLSPKQCPSQEVQGVGSISPVLSVASGGAAESQKAESRCRPRTEGPGVTELLLQWEANGWRARKSPLGRQPHQEVALRNRGPPPRSAAGYGPGPQAVSPHHTRNPAAVSGFLSVLLARGYSRHVSPLPSRPLQRVALRARGQKSGPWGPGFPLRLCGLASPWYVDRAGAQTCADTANHLTRPWSKPAWLTPQPPTRGTTPPRASRPHSDKARDPQFSSPSTSASRGFTQVCGRADAHTHASGQRPTSSQ